MMRKLSKLLAVVLAVAMLLCSAMCLTSMAETQANGYTVTYADDVLTVNVTSEAGFLVSLIKIDVEGYAIDEENIAVTTVEGINFSANPSYENGVLTLLLASKEAANVHLVTGATVTIPAVKEDGANKYYIALTKIQAADAGTATAPESFIDFDGVNTETGAVETVVPTVNETSGPAVDPALVVAGASVGFADSSLQIGFRLSKTVVELYDKVELVIAPQKYDRTTYNLATETNEIIATLTPAGKFYTYTYTDVQLYELGLKIDYVLKAYDAQDNLVAVSDNFSVVPADYLKTLYTTSDALMKTLITDTLIVGAEAAIMFADGKPDCDLAKATSIIAGFDTSAATKSIGKMNTVDSFKSYNASYGNAASSTYWAAKSAGIGKAANLSYRLRDRNALDLNKFQFKVSYTSVKLSGKTVAYNKTFTSADVNVARGGQFVTFAFDEVSFCDSDKNILLEVYYNGTKVYDMTYSIETYFAANLSDAKTGGTITALAKLGISARAVAASKA